MFNILCLLFNLIKVNEFLTAIQADEDITRKLHQVCSDLENALHQISATYKILPFGSSVNGLAFKDSDLDIFYGPGKISNDCYYYFLVLIIMCYIYWVA